MLGTSCKCVGRAKRKREESEANQRSAAVQSSTVPRAGGTKEEALLPEPRGRSCPTPVLCGAETAKGS